MEFILVGLKLIGACLALLIFGSGVGIGAIFIGFLISRYKNLKKDESTYFYIFHQILLNIKLNMINFIDNKILKVLNKFRAEKHGFHLVKPPLKPSLLKSIFQPL
jgi:hypothetical protein